MNIDTEFVERDGKVALRQIGNNQRPVPITVGNGVTYQASLQHNVWLVWVDSEDVSALLTKKIKSCSCNEAALRPLYKPASILDVSLFETGERPH